MNKLEQELKDLRDIRRKRAELMRRLRDAGYTEERIAEIYGSGETYVYNELKWLEESEKK